jgi:hypothetical protein
MTSVRARARVCVCGGGAWLLAHAPRGLESQMAEISSLLSQFADRVGEQRGVVERLYESAEEAGAALQAVRRRVGLGYCCRRVRACVRVCACVCMRLRQLVEPWRVIRYFGSLCCLVHPDTIAAALDALGPRVTAGWGARPGSQGNEQLRSAAGSVGSFHTLVFALLLSLAGALLLLDALVS